MAAGATCAEAAAVCTRYVRSRCITVVVATSTVALLGLAGCATIRSSTTEGSQGCYFDECSLANDEPRITREDQEAEQMPEGYDTSEERSYSSGGAVGAALDSMREQLRKQLEKLQKQNKRQNHPGEVASVIRDPFRCMGLRVCGDPVAGVTPRPKSGSRHRSVAPVRGTIDPLYSPNAVEAAWKLLKWGSVAFNAPAKMILQHEQTVSLAVSPKLSTAELTETLLKELSSTNVDGASARIKISDRMRAELIGPGFTITPILPGQQLISGGNSSESMSQRFGSGRSHLFVPVIKTCI
jgi:hypothetical protein